MPDGERAFQQENVLWNPDHWPTSYWTAGEPVDTMALLHLPPDLPPGDYELRLVVVYDFETQIPTVQIDVWEPETTLARLRLSNCPLKTAPYPLRQKLPLSAIIRCIIRAGFFSRL